MSSHSFSAPYIHSQQTNNRHASYSILMLTSLFLHINRYAKNSLSVFSPRKLMLHLTLHMLKKEGQNNKLAPH